MDSLDSRPVHPSEPGAVVAFSIVDGIYRHESAVSGTTLIRFTGDGHASMSFYDGQAARKDFHFDFRSMAKRLWEFALERSKLGIWF